MTIYSNLMAARMKDNRQAVEKLQKAEYILGILAEMKTELEALGLETSIGGNRSMTIRGKAGSETKIPMKEITIIMDEYIFSNDRLRLSSWNSASYIFNSIVDKDTGGKWEFDIAMDDLECRRVEVSREWIRKEEITYKYECE